MGWELLKSLEILHSRTIGNVFTLHVYSDLVGDVNPVWVESIIVDRKRIKGTMHDDSCVSLPHHSRSEKDGIVCYQVLQDWVGRPKIYSNADIVLWD